MLAKGFGGAERSFVDLCTRLAARGHEVLAILEPRGVAARLLQPEAHLTRTEVRVLGSWDPLARRAIQLGLRGEVLRRYASEWIVRIEDISERVAEERSRVSDLDALHVPAERVYPVRESAVAARLGLAL